MLSTPLLRGGKPQALYAQTADDARMLQPHEDFHLLQEHLLVDGTALKLWLECLDEIPPPEALGAIEQVRVRLVDELKIGEVTLQLLEGVGLEAGKRGSLPRPLRRRGELIVIRERISRLPSWQEWQGESIPDNLLHKRGCPHTRERPPLRCLCRYGSVQ